MYITMECSQKWYRMHKWKHGWRKRELKLDDRVILGYAFGPIMVFFHKMSVD